MDGQYPRFEYAFHLNARWKNFDFAAFFQGVEGKKHFTRLTGFEPFYEGTTCTTKWRDRWTPENPSTTMPRIYIAEAHEYYNQLIKGFFLGRQPAHLYRLSRTGSGGELRSLGRTDAGIPAEQGVCSWHRFEFLIYHGTNPRFRLIFNDSTQSF